MVNKDYLDDDEVTVENGAIDISTEMSDDFWALIEEIEFVSPLHEAFITEDDGDICSIPVEETIN